MKNGDLNNPADPLLVQRSDRGRELFEKIGQVAASGQYRHTDCIDAGLNLIMNAIRQGAKDWKSAEAVFDDLVVGKGKTALRSHYDYLGRRREVFAFDQTIGFDRHIDKDWGQGDPQ